MARTSNSPAEAPAKNLDAKPTTAPRTNSKRICKPKVRCPTLIFCVVCVATICFYQPCHDSERGRFTMRFRSVATVQHIPTRWGCELYDMHKTMSKKTVSRSSLRYIGKITETW